MAKLKVGFVGAGGIARGAHLPAFQALADECEVVAAADVAAPVLETFAAAACLDAGQCYSDYGDMLSKAKLDVAVICTPNSWHCQPTIDAFAAGCHVLCEKPIAISAGQARDMIAAGHKAKKLFMVGQTLRFLKPGAMMKEWVNEGVIGDIYWARAQYLRNRGIPGRLGFVSKELSQGGPIYDIGVHVLDLALWLMDFPEPVSVAAGVYNKLASKKSPLNPFAPKQYTVPDDSSFSLIRFANGATVSLECSWALNIPQPAMNVTVCGEKGGCQYEPLAMVTERHGRLDRVTPEIYKYPEPGGHHAEVRDFIEAIRKEKPSPVPGEQALITQRILDAIYKSGEKGKEVRVE
ncbi:MAG: Gfo/Idh/MocA family oxidoreductase, partial [Armatimonadetes bacterium]|nr:Gfo/Idh/MocA family oxidoreductase [Armatimonadota bacterium]